MTNERLKESLERVARLPEVEPQTFVNFCEYTYSGNYKAVGSHAFTTPDFKDCLRHIGTRSYCYWGCGEDVSGVHSSTSFPLCLDCGWPADLREERSRDCVLCGGADRDFLYGYFDDTAPVACSFCTQRPYAMKMRAMEAYKSFAAIRINIGSLWHSKVEEWLTLNSPDDVPVNNFVAHMKLWVFADMYLVDSLKELCLHKLHRDLQAFVLTSKTAPKVAQLISYLSEHAPTANDEDDVTRSPRALAHAYLNSKTESLWRYGPMEPRLTGEEQLVDVLVEEMRQSMPYGC